MEKLTIFNKDYQRSLTMLRPIPVGIEIISLSPLCGNKLKFGAEFNKHINNFYTRLKCQIIMNVLKHNTILGTQYYTKSTLASVIYDYLTRGLEEKNEGKPYRK